MADVTRLGKTINELIIPSDSTVSENGLVATLAASGGSIPGDSITTRYTVAYNASGLSNGSGYALFTPTVDDVVLSVQIFFPTAFDGTTPKVDIGTGVGDNGGWFLAAAGGAVSALAADDVGDGTGAGVKFPNVLSDLAGKAAVNGSYGGKIRFTAANPVLVWCTQDGNLNGSDPGASQGEMQIVITTTTPIDVP